ncbi:glycosyl hydrolase family 18 protein [Paenibacillus sp. TRM 82003]|nr:glycosyl hydrolase family 18 protein [Paenibacillus sp. TRM 82003]
MGKRSFERGRFRGRRAAMWGAALAAAALLCGALWIRIGGVTGAPGSASELSAWIVEWDAAAGLADYGRMKEELDSVQAFGALFDEAGRLTMTEDFSGLRTAVAAAESSARAVPTYLTVVNDRWLGEGGSIQKDASLIRELVGTEAARMRHIEDIVVAAKTHGFEGVEIDYENIAASDWKNVALFYGALYKRLHAADMRLRIVLEPKAPIERLSLPPGPVYVMMAYNLYGTHSGPGPKADLAFIARLTEKMKRLPGDPVIALSVGGFDWDAAGKATAVTEQEALRLQERSAAKPVRDKDSGSMSFRYTDEAGSVRTVWYADRETLDEWIRTARQGGVSRVAIWRLGGLAPTTADGLAAAYE